MESLYSNLMGWIVHYPSFYFIRSQSEIINHLVVPENLANMLRTQKVVNKLYIFTLHRITLKRQSKKLIQF